MGTPQVVAIGASMGGVVALESVLSRLPADSPPLLVVQHILPNFTSRFVQRLDELTPMRVVEARHGERLAAGTAYIAPAHTHLQVRRSNDGVSVALSRMPPIRFHRPSVDALFHSLLQLRDVDIVAVLLTGMGRDGADGMLALRNAGAQTIVQDEASSLIFGMPKEAIACGAAGHVASLDRLPATILACLRSRVAVR